MATPFIRFPGGSSYVWSADTNMLAADLAHGLVTSTWQVQTSSSTFAVGVPALFGPTSLEVTLVTDAVAEWSIRSETPGVAGVGTPVVVGGTYVQRSAFRARAANRQVRSRMTVRDAAGGFVSNIQSSLLSAPANTWVYPEISAVMPANSAFVITTIVCTPSSGTIPTGEIFNQDKCMFAVGTDGTFLPSLDVAGGRRTFVELSDPSPAGEAYTKGQDQRLGEGYTGDVSSWAVKDGSGVDDPIVAQVTASDALRAIPL